MGDVIYKFLPTPYALQALESLTLKVALTRQLNDIYDSLPATAPSGEGQYFDSGGDVGSWAGNLRAQNGLLCFSKNYVSPLLWGHYADWARRIALGFDVDAIPWPMRLDVEYQQERGILRVPHTVGGTYSEDEIGELMKDIFRIKAKEWEYEAEVRYIVKLDECILRSGMYFCLFQRAVLREVLLGYRFDGDPDYVRRLLRRQFAEHRISLYLTDIHEALFQIQRGRCYWTNLGG
jgi:hypothetical protein